MNERLLNFSSLHPAQLIGKKKSHYWIKDNDGIFNDQFYNWKDTLTKNIIWDTKWGRLSPLIYTLPFGVGNELLNAGATELGCVLTIFGTILPIVDVVGFSLAQLGLNESKLKFAPMSKAINTALFNTAVYTVSFPAKLVAKIMVKKEFAHQNKLLKTSEGRQILINENKAKALQIENKKAIKQAKEELKETKYQTKTSRKILTLNKENDKMDSELKKLKLEIEGLKR